MLTKEILRRLAEEDRDKLEELATYRSKGNDPEFLDYFIEQGVIYVTTKGELDKRLREYGISLASLNLLNDGLVEKGWLFPAYNIKGEWLYWVNYSNKRSSNKKYLNIVQKGHKDKLVFGLDTLPEAMDKNQLVWVEGVIDQCRLASFGVPCVATLGTTVSDYMKRLASRVQSNVIIPDNDDSAKETIGKSFGEKMRNELGNARILKLSYIKDVDECYSGMPEQFFWVVEQLK